MGFFARKGQLRRLFKEDAMPRTIDLEARYERDEKAEIHENAVRQLVQRIASHADGIPETVKNSCDAYSESDISAQNTRPRKILWRVFVLQPG